MNPIIILGSGLAGYNVAKELRKLDKETPLTVITADSGSFIPSPCSPMRWRAKNRQRPSR